MEKFLPHIRIDFVDFVGLKVKPTNHFTGMLPFGKVRLRLNGSSPAPSLSTISIDVYVDEGEGRPGKVPHASLPWPRLDLLDFAPHGAPTPYLGLPLGVGSATAYGSVYLPPECRLK